MAPALANWAASRLGPASHQSHTPGHAFTSEVVELMLAEFGRSRSPVAAPRARSHAVAMIPAPGTSWMQPIARCALIFFALSLSCPDLSNAVAFHQVKGIIRNWTENASGGAFDLQAAGGVLHFTIDPEQTKFVGVPNSRLAREATLPFGTAAKPVSRCASVVYYSVGLSHRLALTITVLDKAQSSKSPCV